MADIAPASHAALEKRLVGYGLLSYFLFSIVLTLSSSGTYDAGDSVMHFQLAHYAFQHPANLLSHWAKPFFTLVAAPFAAFGFGGMKVFQCLLAAGTGWLLYRSARKLNLRFAWLAPLCALAAPEFFLAQLSGLTEPFFGFLLALGIFLFLHDRQGWGAAAFSFLPFVRTEGFILLPLFGLYLLLQGKWRVLPLLALGTAVYVLIGGFYFGDPLWIWTQNPYAGEGLKYGTGDILHYPKQYYFVVGLPIYVLTIIGILLSPIQLFKQQAPLAKAIPLIVLGPFLVYFGAHVYFWASGTGHSFGLMRVMLSVVPLGALLAATGFGELLHWIPEKMRGLRIALLVLTGTYVALFPIIPNPASISAKELRLTVDQEMLILAKDWMIAHDFAGRQLYAAHPSAAFIMGKDPFQSDEVRSLGRVKEGNLASGSIFLVDSWFAKTEQGLTRDYFDGQPSVFRRLQCWDGQEGTIPIEICLFEKI